MGLDTSHDCWHGSYGRFHEWRQQISQVAGYGNLMDRHGFGGELSWPDDPEAEDYDPLAELLYHQDCEGVLRTEICGPLADRMEELLPALANGPMPRHPLGVGSLDLTEKFIAGLRKAADAGEEVDFH